MKTLKVIAAALLIAFSDYAAKADNAEPEKMSAKYATTTYVDAVVYGKIKNFADMVDANATFTMKRGNKILSHSKKQMVDQLKAVEGVRQNCKVSTTIVENLPDQIVLKVNMDYEHFDKIDLVTLSLTKDGWKITNVASTFQ
jgi:hypothetical protein